MKNHYMHECMPDYMKHDCMKHDCMEHDCMKHECMEHDCVEHDCWMDKEMEMCDTTVKGKKKGRLAHAYVPWQFYCKAYNPHEALHRGTLFPELYGVYPIPK